MSADLVVFEVAMRHYAVPLADTCELLRIPTIVPLPKAPAITEGVINVRGQVTPVLDLRKRFGLPHKAPHPDEHIVVVRAGTRVIGFRVDRALGVSRIRPEDIEDAAAITPRAEYLTGIAKLRDGLVLIHDPSAFLAAAEARELDLALDAQVTSA